MSGMSYEDLLISPAATKAPAGAALDKQHIAARRLSLRKLWLKLHLYIGLSVGVFIALMGMTGSLMVFHKEIDAFLNPQLLTTTNSGARAPLQTVLNNVRAAYPQAEHPMLVFPKGPQQVLTANIELPTKTAWVDIQEVYVDPYSAKVLGSRLWGWSLMSFIYNIHFSLWLRDWGQSLVGFIGIFLLISSLTGIYLWWPRVGKWQSALAIKRTAGWRRFNFDLHRTTGACASLVLVCSAFSGVYLVFPKYVEPLVKPFSKLTPVPEELRSAVRPGKPVSIDTAVRIAQSYYPRAVIKSVMPPHDAQGVYQVNLRQKSDVTQTFGLTDVWIDQYSGKPIAVRDSARFTAGDKFFAWLFPLHNGEAFGLAGRLLILIAGWVPAILLVSGVLHWSGKGKKRRKPRLAPDRSKQTGAMSRTAIPRA